MRQFYAVTAQKSTRVTGACVARFAGDEPALAVVRGSRLEFFALREGGLVKTRRDRSTIYYSLADDTVRQLIDIVCDRFARPRTPD